MKNLRTINTEYERGLTFQELATITGYSVSWLKRAKLDFGLPFYQKGKVVRFRLSEFKRWESGLHNPGLLETAP